MYTIAMTFLAIVYILGLFGTASLIMAWFNSGLPLHVFAILNRLYILPVESEEDDVWDTLVSWDDWADKVNIYLPALLAELITCKVCLSFHVSMWVGLLIAALSPDIDWYHAFIAMFTWPILVNRLVPHH